MDSYDIRLDLERKAQAARARTIFIDLGAAALLAATLFWWSLRDPAALGGMGSQEWTRALGKAWPGGLSLVLGTLLAAGQAARRGPDAAGAVADEQRADAMTFGEICCLAAILLEGAAMLTAALAIHAGQDAVGALAVVVPAVALGVLLSCLSSAVRRPTFRDRDADLAAARRLLGAARRWQVASTGRPWPIQVALVGAVPGAGGMALASILALRLDLFRFLGVVALFVGAGIAIGVVASGVHFMSLRIAFLALTHGRPILAALAGLLMLAFDVAMVTSSLSGEVTPWVIAIAATPIVVAVPYLADVLRVVCREPRPRSRALPGGVGVAAAVRASLLTEVRRLRGHTRVEGRLRRWYAAMTGRSSGRDAGTSGGVSVGRDTLAPARR